MIAPPRAGTNSTPMPKLRVKAISINLRSSGLGGIDATTLPSFLPASTIFSQSAGFDCAAAGAAVRQAANIGPIRPIGPIFRILIKVTLQPTSQLCVLELGHFHRHRDLGDRRFEVDANLRIFVFVFDQCAALVSAPAHAFFIEGAPATEKEFSDSPLYRNASCRAGSLPVLKC